MQHFAGLRLNLWLVGVVNCAGSLSAQEGAAGGKDPNIWTGKCMKRIQEAVA